MTLNNNNKIFQATFENVVELSLQKVEEDDNELINFIKRHRLKSPKPREVEYNLAGQPLHGQVIDISLLFFNPNYLP